nr:GNAT family N-acetyltransferase [Allomuricauda sp.]
MTLNLQKCTSKDLEILIKISKETFISAFEKDNNPEDFLSYVNKAFGKDQMEAQLNNPNSHFYFVLDKGTLVGYFKLNEGDAQTELQDEESFELERIYVLDAFQGKSIGTWMLNQAIEIAKSEQKRYLWLGVWEHNPGAIRFYERNGFKKFGTHPYYVGSDKQTDWIMRLDF